MQIHASCMDSESAPAAGLISLRRKSSPSIRNAGREGIVMAMHRRKVLKGLLGAGAGLAAMKAPMVLAQAVPFRIALLTVKTGPLAQGGIQMEQGLLTFLKEKNNTLADRKVELISADTGGSPAGAKTKAQEVIERDRANVILGPLAAFELLAITDYIAAQGTPLVSLAAAEDVTQRTPNPWIVRPSGSSGQPCHAMADYAAKELKLRRVATIADDFAFGYEQVSGFQRVFEDNGGRTVKKLWPPLVTPDYTPYIAQIANVDAVFNGFAGSNPLKFMRSYADLGLKERIPLLGGWTAMDDALLKSLGDEAVGALSAHWYSADRETASNRRFVTAMQKDYDNLPGGYAAGMYIAGQCVEAAMQKAGSQATDKKAFMEALRGVSLTDTPRGPVRFDHLGNVVGDMFIRRCERKAGRLVNTVIKTYPNVGQFWTYDEKAFLAQPVYSRDSPPARYLE
jgi:branched-chain amino acid transport system substrate-binding protein